jgi:soluble epoxide hydrolase / lipid-phosphate phosphatase
MMSSHVPKKNHDLSQIPPVPFLTPEEEDYIIEQYGIQGFRNSEQPS